MSRTRTATSWLAGIGALLSIASCSGGGEPSYQDLLDGVPLDPSEYELTDMVCTKTDDNIALETTITNTSDQARGYAIRYFFVEADGTVHDIVGDGYFAEPGETVEITSGVMNAEDYDDPPECGIEVFISAFEGLD